MSHTLLSCDAAATDMTHPATMMAVAPTTDLCSFSPCILGAMTAFTTLVSEPSGCA